MSVTSNGSDEDSLSLGELDGAVLTYEDAEGETVVVELGE
jgi:hypothetical protein